MPTVTKTKIVTWQYWFNQKLVTDGVVNYNNATAPRGSTGYTVSRTGVAVPKFRSIIKSGNSATSPLTGNDIKTTRIVPLQYSGGFNAVPGDNAVYSESLRGFLPVTVDAPSTIIGTSLQSADNQALSRAYAQLNAIQQQFQGVVFLGELKETLHLLKHPFKGVEDYVKKYLKDVESSKSLKRLKQKRSRPNQKSFLAEASNLWLEVAFGIKPLISDVKDLAETVLKQRYGVKSSSISGSGFSVKAQDGHLVIPLGNYGEARFDYLDQTIQSVRYKGRVDATATAAYGSAEGVLNGLGFNPSSFVPSLYELVPYSFLVDYFTNVGDLISAGCSSQAGLKFVCRTERLVSSRAGVLQAGLKKGLGSRFWEGDCSPGSVLISRSTVNRSGSSLLGMPTLEFSLPGADMHSANILALIFSSERRILKSVF